MVTFQVRGTQLNAWYSKAGKVPIFRMDEGQAAPSVDALGDPSVFGGHAINLFGVGGRTREIIWPGFTSWTRTNEFAALVRIVPQFTGFPSDNETLFLAGDHLNAVAGGAYIRWNNDGTLSVVASTVNGRVLLSWTTTATVSGVSGVAMDIMLAWDGTVANSAKLGVDGVLLETKTAADDLSGYQADRVGAPVCVIGSGFGPASSGTSKFYLNELVCFDNAQSVVYAARTGFFTTTASEFDPTVSVGAGAGNIVAGQTETINGVLVTGTFDAGIQAAAATTKHGVAAADGTGTYRGADLNDVVAANELKAGITRKQDGSDVVGAVVVALAATTKHGVTANDGTGSYRGTPDLWEAVGPSDLSTGVTKLQNGVSVVGTRDTVTNVLAAAVLTGNSLAAVLVEDAT